jgi:hypothetical protein
LKFGISTQSGTRYYGRPYYGYSIEFENASGKKRRVHAGHFTSKLAALRALDAEFAAIAAGKYSDPQLTFDDDLASRGLLRLDAPESQEEKPSSDE